MLRNLLISQSEQSQTARQLKNVKGRVLQSIGESTLLQSIHWNKQSTPIYIFL